MQTTKRHIILEGRKVFVNLEISDLGRISWYEAVEACKKLGEGWRLPTKEELDFLYQNKDNVGGFANSFYWSSTESDYFSAWGQDFVSGNQVNLSKVNSLYVRAIRAS